MNHGAMLQANSTARVSLGDTVSRSDFVRKTTTVCIRFPSSDWDGSEGH